MRLTAVLGLALALSWARGAAAADAGDAEKIQGTWVVSPATFKGVADEGARKEGLKAVAGMRFTFRRGELTIETPPGPPPFKKGGKEKSTFRLAPSKKPKQIDLGEGERGIYHLEGDTLELCWEIRPKKGRPGRFGFDKSRPTVVYYVLKREKK